MDRLKRIHHMQQCSERILKDLLAFQGGPRPAYYGLVIEHYDWMNRYIEYMRRAETAKLKTT